MTVKTIVSTNLYYTEGSSDKVYQIQLEEAQGGYVVNFQFGRRGSSLNNGTKTATPIPLDAARKVYDALERSKRAKGYTTDETGTAYAQSDKAGLVSGVLPQLLTVVSDDELEARLVDNAFCAQQKYDGERLMLLISPEGKVQASNRKGLFRALPQAVADSAIKSKIKDAILDGELVGTTLYVWDILKLSGRDLSSLSLKQRLAQLAKLAFGPDVVTVQTTWSEPDKRSLLTLVQASGGEGVVFKKIDAPYTAGCPIRAGSAQKFKFLATATFRVKSVTTGKRSIHMEMLDPSGVWAPVGKVSIPANQSIPAVGTFAECSYLNANRGGALFQPRYKGERTDQDETDCQMAQLQYKGESREIKGGSKIPHLK